MSAKFHLRSCLTTCAVLSAFAASGASAQSAQDWPPELIDPAVTITGAEPADLILPLPCGGGMAFQRVAVPTEIANPLADRPFRMGQSSADTGFSDYLQPTYLRGPFSEEALGASYYYIARYEMNVAQYRAIIGACDEPFSRRDQFAKGELSWFDAIDLTRQMTEWVLANARDAMPAEGDRNLRRLVPVLLQGPDEIGRMPLRPAGDEGLIGADDGDAHGGSLRGGQGRQASGTSGVLPPSRVPSRAGLMPSTARSMGP